MRVKLEDFKEHQFCNAGLRQGCKDYGWDWWEFLQHGLPVEELEKVNDDNIRKAIESAKLRTEKENEA